MIKNSSKFFILSEIVLFLGTQILGVTWLVFYISRRQNLLVSPANYSSISTIQFLFYFIILTLFVWLISTKSKKKTFIKIIFYIAIFAGLLIFFSGLFNYPFNLLFFLAVILLRLSLPKVWVHDLILVMALASIGASLSFYLSFDVAVLIFAILALYDFFAVFYTKHMVVMFRNLAQRSIFFAFIIPFRKKSFNKRLDRVKLDGEFAFLGTGDVVLPLAVLVTAYLEGINTFIVMSLGILSGMIFLVFLFFKYKRPLPGLPPLAAGILLGYILTLTVI